MVKRLILGSISTSWRREQEQRRRAEVIRLPVYPIRRSVAMRGFR
jgi:hypothetical protein